MLYIFTHTDLDGAASAAAYLIIKGKSLEDPDVTVNYVEPYNVSDNIEAFLPYVEKGDTIVVSDIGINSRKYSHIKNVLAKLISRGATVEWFDHHVWKDDWVNELRGLGVDLHIDRSTCAAGVVVKYAKREKTTDEEFLNELERAVCAADLWKWDHWLAPRLFRIVTLNGVEGEKRRNLVINKLVSKHLWDDELDNILIEYVNHELENYKKIDSGTVVLCKNKCCIGLTFKVRGPPTNSFVGSYILSRYNVRIAGILKSNGSISLRSRDVDVQKIAIQLGGGGHPRAAGAKLDLNLIDRILFSVARKYFLKRIGKRILNKAVEAGLC